MSIRDFYEAYWRGAKAPPQGDPTTGERMEHLRDALKSFVSGPVDRIRVLDAGCGDGEFVAFFRDLGFRVSGVDLSEGAIVRARQRCPDVQFRAASASVNCLSTRLHANTGRIASVARQHADEDRDGDRTTGRALRCSTGPGARLAALLRAA